MGEANLPPRLSSFLALIHRSAWNMNSANFAVTEFCEVEAEVLRLRRGCWLLPGGESVEAASSVCASSAGRSSLCAHFGEVALGGLVELPT